MNRREFVAGAGASAILLPSTAEALTAGQRATLLGGAQGSAYDPAAVAIFNAFTTPPDAARKAIINTCVVSLKANGIWSSLDLLYLTAAADAQAARVNWKNPGTFDLIAVNSPGFLADRGYVGDGASSRLRTQYTPSANAVNYTQNDASAWDFSITDFDAPNSADIGNATAPRMFLSPRASNLINNTINDGSGFTVANTNSIGFFGVQRTTAAARRTFKNGVQVGTDSAAASSGVPAQEQWVCGANSSNFSSRRIACVAWGASLSGKELAFYTTINTYLNSIGAT